MNDRSRCASLRFELDDGNIRGALSCYFEQVSDRIVLVYSGFVGRIADRAQSASRIIDVADPRHRERNAVTCSTIDGDYYGTACGPIRNRRGNLAIGPARGGGNCAVERHCAVALARPEVAASDGYDCTDGSGTRRDARDGRNARDIDRCAGRAAVIRFV